MVGPSEGTRNMQMLSHILW